MSNENNPTTEPIPVAYLVTITGIVVADSVEHIGDRTLRPIDHLGPDALVSAMLSIAYGSDMTECHSNPSVKIVELVPGHEEPKTVTCGDCGSVDLYSHSWGGGNTFDHLCRICGPKYEGIEYKATRNKANK